jgi:hypothetical protein
MLSSPILCLWLAVCGPAGTLPRDQDNPSRPGIDAETLHRQHLEMFRQSEQFLEQQIEWLETLLKENQASRTPESLERFRQRVQKYRDELENGKKFQRELELWEQQRRLNPGPQTDRAALARLEKLQGELWPPRRPQAPPPRPVKR